MPKFTPTSNTNPVCKKSPERLWCYVVTWRHAIARQAVHQS